MRDFPSPLIKIINIFLYLKEDVVRLYDFFLAQPPMMPIYLAATIVLHKSEDVRQVDCDMASVHGILAGIPLNCPPFELLLQKSTDLYIEFPPEKIESDVKDRMKRIQEETRGKVTPNYNLMAPNELFMHVKKQFFYIYFAR